LLVLKDPREHQGAAQLTLSEIFPPNTAREAKDREILTIGKVFEAFELHLELKRVRERRRVVQNIHIQDIYQRHSCVTILST
jgi:hypothetical protein